ncbi:MAG: dCTP deaminase, partial [Candidatus Diapherotrites archaeon]|nr:dCTP deaminase [Candidatus Diapherotrites archaeon]
HPGEFVLGSTMEYVRIPSHISARLDGRSSLGRVGIVIHSTAGTVEPGFEGRLTLEIANVGKLPVALYPGMRVCQISFYELKTPCERPKNRRESKYNHQDGAKESLLQTDSDITTQETQ